MIYVLQPMILDTSPRIQNLNVTAASNQESSKKWYRVTILIGALVVIGVGGFGLLGLLHSYRVIACPALLRGVASVIEAIGHQPPYGVLWLITGGGIVLGFGLGSYGFYQLKVDREDEDIEPVMRLRRVEESLEYPSLPSSQLSRVPPKEDIKQLVQYDLSMLIDWFHEVCPGHEYEKEFVSMVNNIVDKNPKLLEAHAHLPPSFYEDMTLYFNNIIHALSPEQPERKKQILSALAEAANVCPPTWYETARKQLKLLSPSNEGETQLLIWIQEIKEDIIIEFVQGRLGAQWHALNYVRYHVGKELGLDTEGCKKDPYFSRKILPGFEKGYMIFLFEEQFKPKRLIDAMEIRVNQEYRVCFYDLLKSSVMDLGLNEAEANQHVAEKFYNEDCMTVNRAGVAMLLYSIGYFNEP